MLSMPRSAESVAPMTLRSLILLEYLTVSKVAIGAGTSNQYICICPVFSYVFLLFWGGMFV